MSARYVVPVRSARDLARARRWKASSLAECEACGWAPPPALDVPGAVPGAGLLHAHHVVPLSCGGKDQTDNLVVLCPTCHALAHRLLVVRKAPSGYPVRGGPDTPDALLAAIRQLTENPEAAALALAATHTAVAAEVARRVALARESAKRARSRRKQAQQRENKPVTDRATGR